MMPQLFVCVRNIANIVKNVSKKKIKITTSSIKKLTKYTLSKRP